MGFNREAFLLFSLEAQLHSLKVSLNLSALMQQILVFFLFFVELEDVLSPHLLHLPHYLFHLDLEILSIIFLVLGRLQVLRLTVVGLL